MAKFEIGDKVVVVNAASVYDTYKNGDTGVVVAYDECSAMAGYVRREDGVLMNVYWHEVELVEGEKDSTGAESLRNSILNIRSKREALQKEILRLDEQEKEAVEKLKEQGFVLYEDTVSKESASTENKAVLYAEDIEDDMTNPMNWKVGDLLRTISKDVSNILPYGSIQRIVSISGDRIRFTDAYNTCVETVEHITEYFKFHSRPVK